MSFSFFWTTVIAGIFYHIVGTVSGADSKAPASNDLSSNEVIYGKHYDDDGFIYELGGDISDVPQSDVEDLIQELILNASEANVRGVTEGK